VSSDEMIRVERSEIERFLALGLGRYDAVNAVDAGIASSAVAALVAERGCPVTVALQLAR